MEPVHFNQPRSSMEPVHVSHVHLDWLVAEPVTIHWREPSGDLQASDFTNITLYVGCDEIQQRLLVDFCFGFKMRRRASGNRRMHLVLPAESLDPTRTFSRSIALNDSTLSVPFVLKTVGYVAMDSRPSDRDPASNVVHQLSQLESLSHATSFDVLFSGKQLEKTKHDIQKCFMALCAGFQTPDINLSSTFSGTSWVINDWDLYSLSGNERADEDAASTAANNCPPGDETAGRAANENLQSDTTAGCTAHDCLPNDNQAGPSAHETLQNNTFGSTAHGCLPNDNTAGTAAKDCLPNHETAHPTPQNYPPTYSDGTASHGASSDTTEPPASGKPPSPQPAAHIQPAAQSQPTVHAEPATHPETAAHAEPAAHTQPAAHPQPATHSEPAAHPQPTTHSQPSDGIPAVSLIPTRSNLLPSYLDLIPLDSILRNDLSNRYNRRACLLASPTQQHLFRNSVNWLAHAWMADPALHACLPALTCLGQLAQAAAAGDTARFENVRRRMTSAMAERALGPEAAEARGQFALTTPLAMYDPFVDLLYQIVGDGEVLILQDLCVLRYLAVSCGGDCAPGTRDAWRAQMAACLVLALYVSNRDWF